MQKYKEVQGKRRIVR